MKNNTQAGVAAEDASLTLVSIPPNPSVIQGNGAANLALTFGSRSTIDGVQVGAMQCDATVLSRGTSASALREAVRRYCQPKLTRRWQA